MAEVRYRLSWQLALAIVIVVTVAMVPVVVYFMDFKALYIFIISAIVGWSVLVLIALMGAFLLGLAVGHRAASKTDFSPFEVEMLKMREEIKSLTDLVHKHNLHHGDEHQAPEPKAEPEPAPAPIPMEVPKPPPKPAPVEQKPATTPPVTPPPDSQPIAKVRCSQCKTVIPLYTKQRPLEIKCTKCGKVGILK